MERHACRCRWLVCHRQLYRSVNGVRDETYSENATLSRSNSWQHTFENLDKYDENQQPYTYYAEEISVTVGAEKIDVVDDAFTVTLGDGTTLDFAVDYNTNPESDPNTTIITNRTAGQIAVTSIGGTREEKPPARNP